MKINMGKVDRAVRVILALVFFYLFFTDTVTGIIGLLLFLFGVVFMLTSVFGYCPLYRVVGISTCPATKK